MAVPGERVSNTSIVFLSLTAIIGYSKARDKIKATLYYSTWRERVSNTSIAFLS